MRQPRPDRSATGTSNRRAAGPLTVYHGAALGRYGFGAGHPFGPDRLAAFWREVCQRGLDRRFEVAAPVEACDDELLRFHSRAYLDRLKAASVAGTGCLDYGDTPAFAGIFEAGATIVGSDLDGLTRLFDGVSPRIFVPIAGLHHGRRDAAAGFCAFNDCGVLIETLRQCFGVRRIAYVDIDAHHGDGVFYSYEDDPDLIIADIHESGRFLYPGTGFADETGSGAARGTKLNVPLQPGADDTDFHRAWSAVEEFVRAGRPEIILFQAGADSIRNDPLTHLEFTPAAHGFAAERLRRIADEYCDGRLIAFGGGGYNHNNIALAWCAVLESLLQ